MKRSAQLEKMECLISHLTECALSTYCGDVLFLNEVGRCHVEVFYLTDDSPEREIITQLVSDQIDPSMIYNLAGFTLGGISIASLVSYKLQLPLYISTPENPMVNIRLSPVPERNTFALIMGYTSTAEEVIDAILDVEKRGGIVRKVIGIVEEGLGAKEAVQKRGIEFVSLINLSEILDNIKDAANTIEKRIRIVKKRLR